MKPVLIRSSALFALIAIFTTGCESGSSGEPGVFATTSGDASGAMARGAGLSTAGSFATGASTGAVVAATTYIIAKYQASERQRQIAVQRARAYYARISPQKKAAMKKKKVRYIAVDTEKDKRSSPKAKKAIMLWDTQAEDVVGNVVYDVETAPSVGSTALFETYSAEYVGSGS